MRAIPLVGLVATMLVLTACERKPFVQEPYVEPMPVPAGSGSYPGSAEYLPPSLDPRPVPVGYGSAPGSVYYEPPPVERIEYFPPNYVPFGGPTPPPSR